MTIKDILDEFSRDDKDKINRLSEKEKKVNEEIETLNELLEIMRKQNPLWGL